VYAEYGSNAVGDFGPLLNATAKSANLGGPGAGKNISGLIVDAGITRFIESGGDMKALNAFSHGARTLFRTQRYERQDCYAIYMDVASETTLGCRPRRRRHFFVGHFIVDENMNFDRPDSNFTVNAKEHSLLADWFTLKVSTTSERYAVGPVLYTQPTISHTFANIATSMTKRAREGANATKVFGTSYREETYIHITRPWLVLPGVVVFMSDILLVASISLSRDDKQGLWKNTTIEMACVCGVSAY
jgi:hypothetical protein